MENDMDKEKLERNDRFQWWVENKMFSYIIQRT